MSLQANISALTTRVADEFKSVRNSLLNKKDASVFDIVQYNNISEFPPIGSVNKLYIAKDTDVAYYWSGALYVSLKVV